MRGSVRPSGGYDNVSASVDKLVTAHPVLVKLRDHSTASTHSRPLCSSPGQCDVATGWRTGSSGGTVNVRKERTYIEVANRQLADIDWDNRTMVVKGKGGHERPS